MTAQHFRRHHRLLDSRSFSRVFKQAERSRDKYFIVLYRGNGDAAPRLGLAIAKKHCRLASGRNRLKRLVRESFRQHRDTLHGLDVVVLNTSMAHRVSNDKLVESLDRHWQRCRTGPQKRTRRQGK